MSFESALEHLIETGVAGGLRAFASELDAQWVAQALEQGQAATVRRRKLPADSVVWWVVGMDLFRDHSIADVVRRLELVVAQPSGAKGTVVDGRSRASVARFVDLCHGRLDPIGPRYR